jgi:hypothetical protein
VTPGVPLVLAAGVRCEFRYPASPGEMFASNAFARAAGTTVPLRTGDRLAGHVQVISADVAGNGLSVMFTYEIADLEDTP